MRILLLGANGQVGWELQRALAPLGEVFPAHRQSPLPALAVDLADTSALEAMLRTVRPDAIVNAAAYTAVDRAESELERAHAINADAPGVLARHARDSGNWLVHFSTDYVFDGSGDRPWREDDPTGPINVYGRTKRAGEEAIRGSGCRHLVLRTSWVYAARGRNFIRTMLRLAADRDTLQVIDDQFGAPTGAELIADTAAHALRTATGRPELAGTYHLAAAGETTWHGYAAWVIGQARTAGWPIKVADRHIEAVSSDAFPSPARRPHNSRLDCSRLEAAFDLTMPDWRHGVQRALDEILACERNTGT